jgi:hypothetical protein
MNTKSGLNPHLRNAALAGALAVFAMTAFAAQHLPKEGKFAYRGCSTGTSKAIVLSKSHVAYSFESTGEDMADTPGTLFDHASFQCEGSGAGFGKERIGYIVCLYVDPYGDKDMARFTLRDGKWQRQEVAGTGKYDGIVIHADVRDLGPFPKMRPGMLQVCNHVVGTYKLK